MPVQILGVHHVNVQVDDLAATRAFYEGALELTEITRPDFPVDGVWYSLGAQELHIGVAVGHVAPERQHFAVRVADLDEAVRAIEAQGIAVKRGGAVLPGAGHQAFVRDPTGNLIELNQPD